MAEEKVVRRLTAILAADIAGYSRLMGDDEPATLRALKAHQAAVFPLIDQFGGRIIDVAGDGILAEFPSVVDAVECAIDIQRLMATRNAEVPEARRLLFRIGINVGDVIHDEARIYGDGINIAARIEQLAQTGGIAISQQVYDQVRNKVAASFLRLGAADLKNIRVAVAVYKVVLPWTEGRNPWIEGLKFALRRTRVRAAIATFLVTILAAVAWERGWFRDAPAAGPATTGMGVRSIAILPFQRLDARTSEDEYLGVGLADALITNLGNVQQIVVRPTSAVLRYNKAGQEALAAGREQGVDALLEGTIQKAGQRLRLAVRLLRVRDGASLWAGRFDEDFSDVFRMQDSIADQVTRALLLKLTSGQRERMNRRYTDNVKAYQLYLQGRFQWNKFNEEGFRNALGFFEEALKLDPSYALAYVGISESYSAMVAIGAAAHRDVLAKAKAAVEKAVALDDGLAEAHQALGGSKMLLEWDWDGAERELKRSIELNPNLAESHSLTGYLLQARGRPEEAVTVTRTAVDLDPLSALLRSDLGSAFYYARQYDAARAEFEKVFELDPKFPPLFFVSGQALERKGEYAAAIRRCEDALKVAGRDPGILATLGYAHASAGHRDEALGIARELEALWTRRHFPPTELALLYAGMGDRRKAFEWMDKAWREHDVQLLWFRLEPQLDGLRDDPRYGDLMRRMGLAG